MAAALVRQLRFALAGLLVLVRQAHSDAGCQIETTADDIVAGLDIRDKVAVVTGGDSGMGYEVALSLARGGATVCIGSHNETKGTAAAQKIIDKIPGAKVRSFSLDLGSFSSVRTFATQVRESTGGGIHMLINNAGIYDNEAKATADGFEVIFQVNYLGHFLLTELLLPALRQAKGRVVNVASEQEGVACRLAGFPDGCLHGFDYLPVPVIPKHNVTMADGFSMPATTYGIAKTMLIEHAAALALREDPSKVAAFAITPGYVNTSITIGDNVTRRCLTQPPPNPCPFTPQEGAAVSVYCAAAAAESLSGSYISRVLECSPQEPVHNGFTRAMLPELYSRSLQWVGLSEEEPSLFA
ncbi:WWOX [Symbiodinium natans]|uniref:WWOX protein n=1 Tax=Symbiodinium natans TaxID=878477 RepID=A0A812HD09_9DINO|nr:WWOX [Symbiodinium natans]